ncbi:MAG: indole-3-acetate monooxygenase [Gammaproteobacteria bacterium]|jgi:alkylation response protein AidB-like acyl-CoA dehydrogenase|nr:indole-3-acetate monooxygenase [Gammaproteobacteria bacterium]
MNVATQTPFKTPLNAGGALATLLAAVKERRAEFEANQQISDDVVALMKEAGVYRALVARRFGGDEVSPMDFLRLIETISMADGSAGWVASFGFSAIYLSALPVATLQTIYANGPDVVFAGGIYPPQKAVPVAGGLEVSGRWSWGSGCYGAELIGVGIKVDGAGSTGGLPLTAVMPRERVRIVKNWDVNGMKGTGSHDVVVDKVVVPDAWTFIRGGESSLDTPVYRYPTMALAAQVLAVVALGIARAALDDITSIAGGRGSITGAPVLADRAYVQIGIAEAEAALRSARGFFYESTEQAFSTLLAGDELDIKSRNLLRLSSSHAAKIGSQVAQTAYRLSGTTGIFTGHSIAQRFQDALIVPQHAFLSEGTWQSAGRILLGLDSPPGFP